MSTKDEQRIARWKEKGLDPDRCGYGLHEYREIDPSTVNPEDYAKAFLDGQEFLGDVREYNCADNSKHPENKVSLDWLCRVGTAFKTDAPGLEGEWEIVDVPGVDEGMVLLCARKKDEEDWTVIPAKDLGVVVDEMNMFRQVSLTLVRKGKVDKVTRG